MLPYQNQNTESKVENLMTEIMRIKTINPQFARPLEKLCNVKVQNMSAWFKDGMEAAMKAPTALNQQKFYITLNGENVTFLAKHVPLAKLDLGIVKYNFEIGSGKSLREIPRLKRRLNKSAFNNYKLNLLNLLNKLYEKL